MPGPRARVVDWLTVGGALRTPGGARFEGAELKLLVEPDALELAVAFDVLIEDEQPCAEELVM